MAIAQLPPWLDVTPAQFGEAAARGASINNDRARIGVEAAGVANQAAKIQSDSQLAMLQLSLQKQNQDREFTQKATEFAVNSELAKQGMDLTFKDASMKLLSQLSYQKAYHRIASENPNLKPEDVMFKAFAETGYVNPGMAQMFRYSDSQNQDHAWNQKWSAPFDMDGVTVQRNLSTGQIRQVTKNDQFSSVPQVSGQQQKTPASTVASSDRSAQGGYKIGAIYKGGLIYLGGDPNDLVHNWKRATPEDYDISPTDNP